MEIIRHTDEELVEMTKDGDDEAFGILTRRHIDHIYNFVRQYAPQREDADDITQESFMKAWKHIRSFKKGKKFTTWLFTIARNSALDHIKKRKAFSFSQMDTEEMVFADTLKDEEPLPTAIFERKELAKELAEAMEDISPDWRAVLIMRYTDDMTFEEIATVLSRPMNTVKSWHHRAMNKIKETLISRSKDGSAASAP